MRFLMIGAALLTLSGPVNAEPKKAKAAPPDPQAMLQECLAGLPAWDTLVEQVQEDPPPNFGPMSPNLLYYYTCRAVAAGDTAECGKLRPRSCNWKDCVPMDGMCIDDFNNARFARAFITRSPDAPALCTAAIGIFVGTLHCRRGSDNGMELGLVRPACGILFDNRDSPLQASRRLLSLCPMPASTPDVQENLGWLLGLTGYDPACNSGPIPEVRHNCLGFGAFRQAYAAKDPELCGDNGVCRHFMEGGNRACEVYAWKFKADYCAEKVAQALNGPAPRTAQSTTYQ